MKNYNKTTVLIICILFGYLGFHRFYVGKTQSGFVYLFTLGFFGLGWILDIILILTDKFVPFESDISHNNHIDNESTTKSKKYYLLDTSSKTIHEMDCPKINEIPISNRFTTANVQNAFNDDYHTCNICKPLIGNGSFIPSTSVTLEKEQPSLEKEQPSSDTKFVSTAEFIDQLTPSKPLKGTIARLSDREQKDNESEWEFKVTGVTFEGRQEKLAKIYDEDVQSASLQWTEWKGEPAIKVICNKMDIGRIPADDVEFFVDHAIKFISEVYVDYFDKDGTPTYYAKVTVVAEDDF